MMKVTTSTLLGQKGYRVQEYLDNHVWQDEDSNWLCNCKEVRPNGMRDCKHKQAVWDMLATSRLK